MILPPPLLNHDPSRRLREEEQGFQVHLDHVIPVLLTEFKSGRATNGTGVVDQDVQAAHLVNHLLHYLIEPSNGGLLQVTLHRQETPAQRFN
jgi:hypothetical protein